MRAWCNDYEELWGTRIADLVVPLTPARLERSGASHSFPQMNTRLLPPTATSQFPLGRSLGELRLHNHSNSWSSAHLSLGMGSGFVAGDQDDISRRATSETDSDSPSKTGGGGGRMGESLPSLKSSGLLDSWNSANLAASTNTRPRTDMRSAKASPPPLGMESDVRSTALTSMPVGLQWLANESR